MGHIIIKPFLVLNRCSHLPIMFLRGNMFGTDPNNINFLYCFSSENEMCSAVIATHFRRNTGGIPQVIKKHLSGLLQ